MRIKTPDGFILDCIFVKVPHSSKAVIFAHGMTVAKDDEGIFVRAEDKLHKAGFSTLRFDFRAHGKSSGDPIKDFTISGEIIDLETIIKFAQNEGIRWIGIAGASFGGSITSLFLGKHPKLIQAVFLANPVLEYDKIFLGPLKVSLWAWKNFANLFNRLHKFGFIEVGSRKFKMGKPLFDEMKKFAPYKELDEYIGPLMTVHGDKDSYISYEITKRRFDELSNRHKKFVTLKGAEHGFHGEPFETEAVQMIVDFFKKSFQPS